TLLEEAGFDRMPDLPNYACNRAPGCWSRPKEPRDLINEELAIGRKRDGWSMVANKVPKGAKTTPFGNQNPTKTPCFISGLRVAVKTAKPLCAGSIAEPWLEDAGHRFVDRLVWH
ncbi:MAG: hypothetical protein WBM24_12765, partial [Candidatus Sulfotelmatobacter sp.]